MNMKKAIKIISVLQILVASLFLLFTYLLSMMENRIWMLLLFGFWLFIAIGVWQQRRGALLADAIFLIAVSGLFLFGTYWTIARLLNETWEDHAWSYFWGFIVQLVILIPALVSLGVLLLCRRAWWNPPTKG